MKTKIFFIIFTGLFIISCGEKKEVKEIVVPIKKEEKAIKKVEPPIVEEVKEVNPLSNYISDEVYNEGIKIFYGDKESMFTENTDIFSGNQEELKASIEKKFKLIILAKQNGINSAVVYYLKNGSKNRTIISGVKMIEIEKMIYFIKVFNDRIEIKQGKNGIAIPLYLRER